MSRAEARIGLFLSVLFLVVGLVTVHFMPPHVPAIWKSVFGGMFTALSLFSLTTATHRLAELGSYKSNSHG